MRKDVLDLEDLLERVQDDRELLLELLDIFEEDYKKKRTLLTVASGQKDFEQIRNIAHSMKGAAGNISAKAIHQTCAQMEQLADKADLSTIPEVLANLDKQFLDLQQAMGEIRKNSGR